MGDLDAILQDFSYLKSLEHKNQAPKRLSSKLYLPDASVSHAIQFLFEKTGEATFERIFNRPIGQRVFQEFIEAGYGREDPTAARLLDFTSQVRDMASESPTAALQKITEFRKRFIQQEDIQSASVFSGPVLQEFEAKVGKLTSALSDGSKILQRNLNLKELFGPFLPEAREYLSKRPWTAFRESPFWIRYCQWKHLELNYKISESDFEVHRILGRGGFGEVFGCRKLDSGAMFAMKKLDKRRLKSKHQETSAVHERNVLSEMHSKFVTNLKYAFHDRDTLYLILDLMEGGDLNWHLKTRGTLKESEAQFYVAEIVLGIAHIHSRNMIYRDLKPANILLDAQGHARISDLGLVRDLSKSLPTSECGTHGYMAPEVLLPNTPYGIGADWWSLGCVIYQLLAGATPFRGADKTKVTKEEIDRRTHSMTVEYPDTFSVEVRDLISQLLDRDPVTRLGCRGRDAAEVRAHPWFDSVDWAAMIDHKVLPPFRPSSNMVNAQDVHEIDRFDSWDLRGVTVTPADDQKYYSHFEHIMSHHWQEELLGSVYDMAARRADTVDAKSAAKIASSATEPEITSATMQGYLLKKGGIFGSFHRRYVVLLPDRIEWRKEQRQFVARAMPLADLSSVESTAPLTITLTGSVGSPLVLRAESKSDFNCWMELLKDALNRVKNTPAPQLSAGATRSNRLSAHEDTLTSDTFDPQLSESRASVPSVSAGEGQISRTYSQISSANVKEDLDGSSAHNTS